MDVKVKQVPARIGAGLSVQGYAIICDSQIREWFQYKEEADRIAGLFKDEATNPEDY